MIFIEKYSAGDAAWAAGAAAKEKMKIKILEYGISLLEQNSC